MRPFLHLFGKRFAVIFSNSAAFYTRCPRRLHGNSAFAALLFVEIGLVKRFDAAVRLRKGML